MIEVPLGNLTALNQEIVHAWMPGARVRGTSDIFYSCLITIVLCVYSAVHLNIPPPREGWVWQYLRKLKWVSLGIAAPEIVLFTAFSQWKVARKLVKELNEERQRYLDQQQKNLQTNPNGHDSTATSTQGQSSEVNEHVDSKFRPLEEPFDLAYGFYAVMGGLRVDVSKLADTVETMVLSPYAIHWLAQQNVFLEIPQSTIDDKSNADYLAKILACLQILWMSVECVARLIKGYPLTLLEVHTFVHVVCASAMYAFWFQKPLNVGEATTIMDLNDKLLAYIICNSNQIEEHFVFRCNCTYCTYCTRYESFTAANVYDKATSLDSVKQLNWDFAATHVSDLNGSSWSIYCRRSRKGIELKVTDGDFTLVHHDFDGGVTHSGGQVMDKVKDRHQLAKQVDASVSVSNRFTRKDRTALLDRSINMAPNPFTKAYNSYGLPRETGQILSALILQVLYGVVHAAAWNSFFPTTIERWLWRGSVITLVSFQGLAFIFVPALAWLDDLSDKYTSTRIFEVILWLCLAIIGLTDVLARVYIVVECFVSLRAVPIGVYAAVPWTSYIAHF